MTDGCLEFSLTPHQYAGGLEVAFPHLHLTIRAGSTAYQDSLNLYSILASLTILLASLAVYRTLQEVSHNQQLAKALSPASIAINLIWNFFFFAIHFKFAIQGGRAEHMQYLGIPAFLYFLLSFTLEYRLFILVWRAQLDQNQIFDSQYVRRNMTTFYFLFYVLCFVMVYT